MQRERGYGGAPAGGGRHNEVREGDWPCPSCQANNFASRNACFRCQTPRPASAGQAPAFNGGGGGRGETRPGDWPCPSCQANNFASREYCFKCQTPKPAGM